MRVAFAGTPAFAAQALQAILAAGFEVPLVLTQPDRPSGRGLKLQPSAVKRSALEAGITVLQPASLKAEEARDEVVAHPADILVVAAYGLILPKEVLAWPRLGCLNIHASLLPRWRGAAPIQRALLAGDKETGISIMQMDQGLDTGPVLSSEAIAIGPEETGGSLHDRLAALGARLVVEALQQESKGQPLSRRPQALVGASYAAKLKPEDSQIDWSSSADEVERRVRALNPAPGAATRLHGETCKIWRAQKIPVQGNPGEILQADRQRLIVACGEGALRVFELQAAGSKRLEAGAFLAGHKLHAGQRLG